MYANFTQEKQIQGVSSKDFASFSKKLKQGLLTKLKKTRVCICDHLYLGRTKESNEEKLSVKC